MDLKEKQPRWLEPVLSVLLITLVTIVAYGFMLPKLGFYRDDWYMIWTAQAQGAQGVMDLFKIDRPFIGVLYAFDYSLLGKAALNWQIYALFVKLIGGLALYWLFRMLWPKRRMEATFATLLFMVYPGFYQQPNAALFINLLLSHSAAILSIALTVYAVRTKNVPTQVIATLLALGLALFYLIIYEAMVGLEVARILILGYALYQRNPTKDWKSFILTTLKYAIPYLIVTVGFVYWRIFLFQSTRRATSVNVLVGEYAAAPLHAVLRMIIETAKDFFDISTFAWTVPLYQNITSSAYRDLGESLILAVLAVALVVAYYVWAKRRKSLDTGQAQPARETLHMLILGAVIILVTDFPIVAAGRDVSFAFQWDRYTAQSTLGVALLMVGIAFYYIRHPARWVFLLALIVSGVVTQYQSAVYYRDFWTIERNMWWQLSWRAPDLQLGTTVIASAPAGYRYLEEYEVWGPLNIIYNPGGPLVVSGQVPFDGIADDLAAGKVETRTMRSIQVPRDYRTSLIISMPTPNSCLHVINGQQTELPDTEDSRVSSIASYSNPDLILTDATPHVPSSAIFGKEPKHDWCYYYEKIDLARQTEDWNTAEKLVAEVDQLGLLPADRSEWLPVIETYVNMGNMQKASDLALKIKDDKGLHHTLCDQLKATTNWPASTNSEGLLQVVCGN